MDVILQKLVQIEAKLNRQQRQLQELKTLSMRGARSQLNQLKAVQKAFHMLANSIMDQREEMSDALGLMNVCDTEIV